MVVYQYVCRCDCRYVGRTSQKLQDRIIQHIPRCIGSDKRPTKNLHNRQCKITSTPSVYRDFAIGQHLLENKECAKHFNDAQFFVLATARSSFHLSVLEATYINALQPILCRKRNSFIHFKFHIIFFFTFPTKPKPYFSTNQIARMTNFDQSENDKKFSIFSILLHLTLFNFRRFFIYFIKATHCHFNVVNLYIYDCVLVFLHSSVDS